MSSYGVTRAQLVNCEWELRNFCPLLSITHTSAILPKVRFVYVHKHFGFEIILLLSPLPLRCKKGVRNNEVVRRANCKYKFKSLNILHLVSNGVQMIKISISLYSHCNHIYFVFVGGGGNPWLQFGISPMECVN